MLIATTHKNADFDALASVIAARLILNGGITVRGVQIPIWREIYEPVLAELAERGVSMHEHHVKSFRGPLDASPLG